MSTLSSAYAMGLFLCLVATYLGALVFGAAAVAPLAVRLLPAAASAVLLRAFWVRFHRLGAGVGGLVTVIMAGVALNSSLPPTYSTALTVAAALMTLCLFIGLRLIPAINAARDAGDGPRFRRLHGLDVALVGIALLLGFALLAGLVYVLPSFFTASI